MSNFLSKINIPFSRLAIFVIYFWFGLLKVVGESPASPLVKALFDKTITVSLPSIGFNEFIIFFGILEMVIGAMFLLPKMDKISIPVLLLHIVTTIGPLVILPTMVFTKTWVLTLEGQYIIKNIAIIGLALNIFNSKNRT